MDLIKNREYIVDIIDNGIEGEGIAKIDKFTVFIPQTLKGERVKIIIVKIQSSYAYGKVIKIIEKSKYRQNQDDCSTYKRCGGCNLRYINYEKTLDLKQNMVENCLKKAMKREIFVKPIIGMGNPFYYRNKLQYPIGIDKKGTAVMGVYASRSHDIIPTEECLIQNKKIQEIANDSFDFLIKNGVIPYDELRQIGILRHIVVRIGFITNEVMLILVLNNNTLKKEKDFIDYITKKHIEIKTIIKNINNKNTNIILGKENNIIYGPRIYFRQARRL